MAATAQEKAYNLKDSYVAGLIEGGATAPIQGMPKTDMGDQAGVFLNLVEGKKTLVNDGNPSIIITDANRQRRGHNPAFSFPTDGSFNSHETSRMSREEKMNAAETLYSGSNKKALSGIGMPPQHKDSIWERIQYHRHLDQ